MSKLTKTLDVSGVSDSAIANFEKLAAMGPEKVALLTEGSVAVERLTKERDEMKRVVQITLKHLRKRDDFGFNSPTEYADAIEKVLRDQGIPIE